MNTKTIKLDINKRLYEKITAKQGDTKSRFLLFHLLDGASPFSLVNRTVRVYGLKPDKKEIFNDLKIVDANKGHCELELTNQALAIIGDLDLELAIYEGESKLTSIPFTVDVLKSINSTNAIESSNEYKALDRSLTKVEEWNNEFADKSGKLEQLYTERLNGIDSHLADNVQYIVQEDYVESIRKKHVQNNFYLTCNNVDEMNYKICFDIGNGKGISYGIGTQRPDKYLLLKGGSVGDFKKKYEYKYQQNIDIAFSERIGSFIDAHLPTSYTSEVGAKVSWKLLSGITSLFFYAFKDNRGGIWEFKLYYCGEVIATKQLSVFNTTAVNQTHELFVGLNPNFLYNLVAEFKGADPNNPPNGATARGWINIAKDTSPNSLQKGCEVGYLENEDEILYPESNKDFAFQLKREGQTYERQFIPMHADVQVSFPTKELKVLADGIDIRNKLQRFESIGIKNSLEFIQNVQFKIPTDSLYLATMTVRYIFFKDGVVEVRNTFTALEDLRIDIGYTNMFPVKKQSVNTIKTSINTKHTTNVIEGITDFVLEQDYPFSYVCGGVSDNVACMTTLNPIETMRKGTTDRRADSLLYYLNNGNYYTKLYMQVFQNALLTKNTIFSFGNKFLVSNLQNSNYIL